MNRQYTIPHSLRAIEREIENAETITEKENTGYPDSTYEDGVKETLRWVLGLCPPPTSDAIEHLSQ